MNKRALIVVLAGLNLLLLGGLVLSAYHLPEAKAQVGMGANYLAVAHEFEDGIETLCLLNLNRQELSFILINREGNKPEIVGIRRGPDFVSDLRAGSRPERAPRRR
jgi:hypothetical protein